MNKIICMIVNLGNDVKEWWAKSIDSIKIPCYTHILFRKFDSLEFRNIMILIDSDWQAFKKKCVHIFISKTWNVVLIAEIFEKFLQPWPYAVE